MADQHYSFSQARTRLEDIVAQVRKKDTTLEKSLDLLEEGVKLANVCTELSDHTEWRSVVEEASQADALDADESVEDGGGAVDAAVAEETAPGQADEGAPDESAEPGEADDEDVTGQAPSSDEDGADETDDAQ